jgi:TolB-like protein/Flp pilus assembly protein TadD
MTDDHTSIPRSDTQVGDWEGAVSDALRQILASAAFAGSRRSRDFLAYVVTETLAGRGARLSERTVARHALQYSDSFDGRHDASVRVRASRVRRALEAYYESEGAEDLVRIELPSGTYAPTFTLGTAVPRDGRRLEPGVLVMAFVSGGDAQPDAGTALSESIVGRLACFPGLRVIGPATSRVEDPARIGRQLGARYVLQGSVVGQDDVLRLQARVTDAESREIIWAVSDTLERDARHLWAVADEWVDAIVGELGDYAGVLLPRSTGDTDASLAGIEAAASLAFYRYISDGTNASLLQAREALARARAAGTQSPAVLAMYANAVAVAAAYGLADDQSSDLEAAEAAAREALALDPRNAHAHLELGTVALVRGQWDLVILRAREGVRLGALHPTMLATGAVLLALAGAWDEGVATMREALRLNPSHPGYMHQIFALDRILAGDDAAALAEASLIHAPDAYWGPFYRSLALARLGYHEQARAEFSAAVALEPALAEDPWSVLGSYARFTDEQQSVLLERVALVRDQAGEASGTAD